MNNPDDRTLSGLRLEPQTKRVLEASLSAGTAGHMFWAVQALLSIAAAALLVVSLIAAVFAAMAQMAGQGGGWQVTVACLVFATPMAIFLSIQLPFLRRLRER